MAVTNAKMAKMMLILLILLLVMILTLIGVSLYKWINQGVFPMDYIAPIALVISSTGILYLQYQRLKKQVDNA